MFSQAKDDRAKKLVKVFACRIRILEKKKCTQWTLPFTRVANFSLSKPVV